MQPEKLPEDWKDCDLKLWSFLPSPGRLYNSGSIYTERLLAVLPLLSAHRSRRARVGKISCPDLPNNTGLQGPLLELLLVFRVCMRLAALPHFQAYVCISLTV